MAARVLRQRPSYSYIMTTPCHALLSESLAMSISCSALTWRFRVWGLVDQVQELGLKV
jgi:hypothetical protein